MKLVVAIIRPERLTAVLEQLYRALSIGAGIQYHRKPF